MRVRLEDVCEKESSKLKQSDVIDQNGLYPVYGASGYLGSINTYQQSNYYVAVVKDGAGIGRTMLLPPKSSIIGTMQYLIPKDNVQPEYLYYVVKAKHLEKYFSGATIPHIYFKDYKNEQFDLVSFEKQRDIINRLKKIEIIIDSLSKILVLLDELVRARFVEMFGDEKKQIIMRDVCSIITDGTHQPPDFKNIGIPFIFVSNIAGDKLTYNVEKYIDQDTYDELIKRTPIEVGDVLLSTVGSYGHAAVVKENKKFLFQRHIAYLKPKSELINSDYLHGAILSPNVQEQIERAIKGIAQKTLNLSEVKKLVIPLPSMEKQNQFASFVKEIDKSRSRIQKSLEASQELFDSLMQEYFG